MHHLGQTRSVFQSSHLLQSPETFVRAPLPGMQKATAIVHVSPALGARFTQYTAEIEPGGSVASASEQRFIFVLDGEVEVNGVSLPPGDFAYMPAEHAAPISSKNGAHAAVIEKPYEPLPGIEAPACFAGRENHVIATALAGDEGLEVRSLLPDDPSFDFAVNTMTYLPGAALPHVEIHVMEHGLLMLSGGGIYRLGENWYPVKRGDFIWMAPFCPQWFGALGKTPAKYLIYKDWNRGPLVARDDTAR
jgi:(S)-ureidoglycine aminohydrolase